MSTLIASVLIMSAFSTSASAKGVLVEHKGSLRARVDANAFHKDLRIAMSEVLGCGGELDQDDLAKIEKEMTPIWKALPKNAKGRVERRSLRYLAHRYFYQKSALQVRGFEPSRPVDEASWGSADLLSQGVPAYLESFLASQHAQEHGFDLHDAVHMVAMLKRLIFDSEAALLDRVYQEQHKPTDRPLNARGLQEVLEAYLVHWMMSDDLEGIQLLLANRTLLESSFPHWDLLVPFAAGQIKALDFERQHIDLRIGVQKFSGRNALAQSYTFDDAHEVVGGITRSFASFWESECASMKDSLIKMDDQQTGRVPLAKFYGKGLDAEWRFGESETYLRELGALDETSSWRGNQVMIPNYIQAASNCIVSTPHYMVCCINECDARLAEIEGGVGAPLAAPDDILALVGNMSSQSTIDEDVALQLSQTLHAQLREIAATHNGQVPLHGRLFSQWLHYVFPRECPYPHKAGVATRATPMQFGNDFLASDDEMKMHASAANSSEDLASVDKNELQWMSQWSSDEELISDYDGALRAPWDRGGPNYVLAVILLAVVGFAGLWKSSKMTTTGQSMLLPTYGKSHFV